MLVAQCVVDARRTACVATAALVNNVESMPNKLPSGVLKHCTHHTCFDPRDAHAPTQRETCVMQLMFGIKMHTVWKFGLLQLQIPVMTFSRSLLSFSTHGEFHREHIKLGQKLTMARLILKCPHHVITVRSKGSRSAE